MCPVCGVLRERPFQHRCVMKVKKYFMFEDFFEIYKHSSDEGYLEGEMEENNRQTNVHIV